jgi:hypothetical protein
MAEPLAPFIHQLFRVTFTFLVPLAILGAVAGLLKKGVESWAINRLRGVKRSKSGKPSVKQQDFLLDSPPCCPRCRKPMVRRTANKGLKADSAFWGCSAFPGCKGTRGMG